MNNRAKKSIVTIVILLLGSNIVYCLFTIFLGDNSSYLSFLILIYILVMLVGLAIVGTAFARENITQGHIGVIYRIISIEEQMSQRRDAIRSEHGSWMFGAIVFFSGLLLYFYNWFLGSYISNEFGMTLPLWSHSLIPAVITAILIYYRYRLTLIGEKQAEQDKDIIM